MIEVKSKKPEVKSKKPEVKPKKVDEKISVFDMSNALYDAINDVLEDIPIVIEPLAHQKMMCMMAMMDEKLEVYGKLIVEIEECLGIKYPIVRDILIPYQTVSSTSFDSNELEMSKWIDELNRNEDGSLKPLKEVNDLTKKMMGHFHSHDSVGGCGASVTDTNDMIEHVANRDFWIEIIGTKKEFKGRIALSKPFNTMLIERKVVTKWWTVAEDVLDESEDKIIKKTYTAPAPAETGSKTFYPYTKYDIYNDDWYYDKEDKENLEKDEERYIIDGDDWKAWYGDVE